MDVNGKGAEAGWLLLIDKGKQRGRAVCWAARRTLEP